MRLRQPKNVVKATQVFLQWYLPLPSLPFSNPPSSLPFLPPLPLSLPLNFTPVLPPSFLPFSLHLYHRRTNIQEYHLLCSFYHQLCQPFPWSWQTCTSNNSSRLDVFEAKIEESEKSYDNQTTISPHNPLYIYCTGGTEVLQSHTRYNEWSYSTAGLQNRFSTDMNQ